MKKFKIIDSTNGKELMGFYTKSQRGAILAFRIRFAHEFNYKFVVAVEVN